MELRHVIEKTINGLSIRTDNETEMNANKGKISVQYYLDRCSTPNHRPLILNM
jgi:hypothetical protein